MKGDLNELALFAGAGGGILGGTLLGWTTVCAVEWECYPASVLCARQNDRLLPPFPIWDDVQTFDGNPWRGIVDVVSGGFPCQDISSAGKGAGIDGARSGMWKHMARIIREVQPLLVLVENSPVLTSRGLDVVLGDLAEMGFDAEWGVLSASDVGANHQRKRIWILATNTNRSQCKGGRVPSGTYPKDSDACSSSNLANPKSVYAQGQYDEPWEGEFGRSSWWQVEPKLDRVVNGMADRVDRLKAIGNGQVPLCAAIAYKTLSAIRDL